MHLAKDINKRLMESKLLSLWDTTITLSSFVRMMDGVIGPFGAKAIIRKEKKMRKTQNGMKISGYYQQGKRGMEIVVLYHVHRVRKTIHLTTKLLNKIIFLTSQTVQHELNHQFQFERLGEKFYTKKIAISYSNKIGKKRSENIDYCCMKDEIDCCGRDIAMEIKYNYPNISPRKVLNTIDSRRLFTFQFYKRAFQGVEWPHVRKALLKKVWKWLPEVSTVPKFAP